MVSFESLFPIVFAMMNAISPDASHSELASAATEAIVAEPALFRDDESREKTAALVVAVAFRESSLRNEAVGDKGRSVCAMQIHGGARSLLDDPEACFRRGIRMLAESKRVDRENPVAFYARGPRFRSEEARRISRDRVSLAQRILRIALQK